MAYKSKGLSYVTHQLRLCSVSSYRWDPGRRNSFYDNKCFEQIMQSTVLTYHSGVGEIWSKEEVDVHFLSAENTQLPFLQATLCPQAGRWVVLYIQTSCFLRLYLIVPPSQRVGHCLYLELSPEVSESRGLHHYMCTGHAPSRNFLPIT